jgi:hypothetical protein
MNCDWIARDGGSTFPNTISANPLFAPDADADAPVFIVVNICVILKNDLKIFILI